MTGLGIFAVAQSGIQAAHQGTPFATWAALGVGALGLCISLLNAYRAVKADNRASHQELEVTHGWQFRHSRETRELQDVIVCVTMYNRGGKPLHVQYVGFEALALPHPSVTAHLDVPEGGTVLVPQRFEIALNGEVIELAPDGPPRKVWTRMLPICQHGVHPTATPIRAYATTHYENYWWSDPPDPLLPQPSQFIPDPEAFKQAVEALVLEEIGGEEGFAPAPMGPNHVVGLQRVIIGGEDLHIRDLWGPKGEGEGSVENE